MPWVTQRTVKDTQVGSNKRAFISFRFTVFAFMLGAASGKWSRTVRLSFSLRNFAVSGSSKMLVSRMW